MLVDVDGAVGCGWGGGEVGLHRLVVGGPGKAEACEAFCEGVAEAEDSEGFGRPHFFWFVTCLDLMFGYAGPHFWFVTCLMFGCAGVIVRKGRFEMESEVGPAMLHVTCLEYGVLQAKLKLQKWQKMKIV